MEENLEKLSKEEIAKRGWQKTATVCKGMEIYVDNKGYMYIVEEDRLIYTTNKEENEGF